MNLSLFTQYGEMEWVQGFPDRQRVPLLPHAQVSHARIREGIIVLQEIRGLHVLLRYFNFLFCRKITLIAKEQAEGLQSLLLTKGQLQYGPADDLRHFEPGTFSLMAGAAQDGVTIIPQAADCQVLNAYYDKKAYGDYLAVFPSLKKAVGRRSSFFITLPRPARHTVHDAIREIFYAHYTARLARYFWELQLRQALFAQLAQIDHHDHGALLSPQEDEMAGRVLALIGQDLSRHRTLGELSALLHWSASSLKRAFQKRFGMGIYAYLRKLRMQAAREMLLRGEQVKTVAPAVGMRPTNFTTEFRKYFGYHATSLRKRS